jgi:hypothetical protein
MLAMVFQGVHLHMFGEVLLCLGSDTLFTSGLPLRVMLNGIFYNTSCQGYHNTMINENDAC